MATGFLSCVCKLPPASRLGTSQSSRSLTQARKIVGSGDENGGIPKNGGFISNLKSYTLSKFCVFTGSWICRPGKGLGRLLGKSVFFCSAMVLKSGSKKKNGVRVNKSKELHCFYGVFRGFYIWAGRSMRENEKISRIIAHYASKLDRTNDYMQTNKRSFATSQRVNYS